jgi:cell division protein FtsB
MDDRARLDERYLALCQRLEGLASQVSELEKLRDRVAEAERRISTEPIAESS